MIETEVFQTGTGGRKSIVSRRRPWISSSPRGGIAISNTSTFTLASHSPIRDLVHRYRVVTVHIALERKTLPKNTDLDFLKPDNPDKTESNNDF